MLTCKDASQLMSQSFDRRLGFMEKTGLRIHLAICKTCQVAYRQLDFIHQICKRAAVNPDDVLSEQPSLTTEAKERILKELHQKQDGKSTSGE